MLHDVLRWRGRLVSVGLLHAPCHHCISLL
jgi:hypothetical protein